MPDFQQLLNRTSRTFGLAIPLLKDPLRHEMTLAYLLFRVADTLEDAERMTTEARQEALREFGGLLCTLDLRRAQSLADDWVRQQPLEHAGYLELLSQLPVLLRAVGQLDPQVCDILCNHASRTVDGMIAFLARCDCRGNLELSTRSDLQQYCYTVAGIVGELITELFLARTDRLRPASAELRRRASSFGEGLQLVNILKDAREDAENGRCYLPTELSVEQVFKLARADLDEAVLYVAALQRMKVSAGIIQFTELPILLARRTLDLLEREGPAVKLSRAEVASVMSEVVERSAGGYETPDCVRQFVHADSNESP